MLIEEWVRIGEKLAEFDRIQAEARRLAEYQRSREKVEAIHEQLRQTATICSAFREAGLPFPRPHEKVTKVAETLALLAQVGPTDGEQLRRINLTQLERDCGEIVAFTTVRLKESWINYLQQIAPAINRDVLSVLKKIVAFGPQIRIVEDRLAAFERLTEGLPRTAGQITALRVAATSTLEAFQQLHTNEIPPEVLLFLRQATSYAGAPLGSQTGTVSDWLKEQKLESAFSIRPKAQE
jgi:hypothetical protein